VVACEVGVEQIQRDASGPDLPDGYPDLLGAEPQRERARRAIGAGSWTDRRIRPVDVLVALVLPPLRRQPLMCVAARIHQPDTHQGHAEIAGFAAIVAREDAVARRVHRDRLMQRELTGDPRNRRGMAWQPGRPPGPRAGAHHVEPGERPIVLRQKLRVSRRVSQPLGFDQVEQQDRVMVGESPQRVIQIAKHFARGWIPAPPEVVGKLVQTADPLGQRRQGNVAVHRTSS
jgi:hypothetical protein